MPKVTTGARLREIMRERGLLQSDVLKLAEPFCKEHNISLQKGALSQYINDKVEPGQEKLFLLGQIFNVSEGWLMGYDVPREKDAPSIEYSSDPGARWVELETRVYNMTPGKRDYIANSFLSQLDRIAPSGAASNIEEWEAEVIELLHSISPETRARELAYLRELANGKDK